jgi:hypothetical protein
LRYREIFREAVKRYYTTVQSRPGAYELAGRLELTNSLAVVDVYGGGGYAPS